MASGPEAEPLLDEGGLAELVRRVQIGDQAAIRDLHSTFATGIEFLLRRNLGKSSVTTRGCKRTGSRRPRHPKIFRGEPSPRGRAGHSSAVPAGHGRYRSKHCRRVRRTSGAIATRGEDASGTRDSEALLHSSRIPRHDSARFACQFSDHPENHRQCASRLPAQNPAHGVCIEPPCANRGQGKSNRAGPCVLSSSGCLAPPASHECTLQVLWPCLRTRGMRARAPQSARLSARAASRADRLPVFLRQGVAPVLPAFVNPLLVFRVRAWPTHTG